MNLPDDVSARSVLVVDDEPDVVRDARRLLEDDGFAVTAAQSGEAALKLLEQANLQLVLLDLSLSDSDDTDLLTAVQAIDPDMPVILITTHDQLEEARRAVRHGAFQYIQKPLAADDLVAACRRAIETVQLRVENRILKQATNRIPPLDRLVFSARPERAAMERAALTRVTQFMGEAISKTSTRVLEQALGESTSDVAFTDVLAEILLDDAAAGGEWAEALLRGAQVQRDLLQEAGGTLSASDVGTLLGIGRAAVDKRRRQGALLGLRLPSGDFVYPAAQFAKGDVVPGLPDVLGAFRIQDPWMQLDVLLGHDESLGGRTAFEALADGDVDQVKAVVSSAGEQGL